MIKMNISSKFNTLLFGAALVSAIAVAGTVINLSESFVSQAMQDKLSGVETEFKSELSASQRAATMLARLVAEQQSVRESFAAGDRDGLATDSRAHLRCSRTTMTFASSSSTFPRPRPSYASTSRRNSATTSPASATRCSRSTRQRPAFPVSKPASPGSESAGSPDFPRWQAPGFGRVRPEPAQRLRREIHPQHRQSRCNLRPARRWTPRDRHHPARRREHGRGSRPDRTGRQAGNLRNNARIGWRLRQHRVSDNRCLRGHHRRRARRRRPDQLQRHRHRRPLGGRRRVLAHDRDRGDDCSHQQAIDLSAARQHDRLYGPACQWRPEDRSAL
jgi:hypothetical protein